MNASSENTRRPSASQIAFFALVAAIIAFGLANFTMVRVNWLFGTSRTPLIIALGLAYVLGAVTAALALRARRS